MEIFEEKSGDVLTLALKGRLDAASSGGLEKRILELIQAGERLLVMDLAELEYISSVGLRVLMVAAKRLNVVKGRVVLCRLSVAIQQVFDIAGFAVIFQTFPTRQDAVESLR